MRSIVRSAFAVVFLIILYASCESLENASNVPEITFKEFNSYIVVYDTNPYTLINAGELVFDFIDGDADLGEYSTDISNIFLLPWEKVDGEYFKVDSVLYGQSFSFKTEERLEREGQYTTIKGEIRVQLLFPVLPPFDTMKYDFYIVDRANHKSNVESTTDITFVDL